MRFPHSMLLLAFCAMGVNASAADTPAETEATILARIQAPVFAKRDFPITDFGAVEGADCTAALGKAIAACHGAGGGSVIVPAGVWLTGAVHLQSNVNLYLAEGATLRFDPDPANHAQTGRLVAEHLLARGLRHFLFYSDSENWSQEERGAGFVAALEEAGRGCEWLRWKEGRGPGRSEWLRRRAWLLGFLQRAPKPAGVFTANGSLAVEVQELCAEAELAVPGDIAIVGIEDYLLSVGGTHRSISGVDTNLEEQGYQGAAQLDRLMRGARVPKTPVRIAPAQVITRKSSDILAVDHRGVARALRFIGEHYANAIGVDDVARAAGLSRRGLHQAFCEHVGCTPGEKIRAVRLGLAKQLLRDTEEKVESIAHQSGYPNLNTFFLAFRKAERSTPAEFRKVARLGK